MANPGLFFYFRPFLITISLIKIEKSIRWCAGIQTLGHRKVGTDETLELWPIVGGLLWMISNIMNTFDVRQRSWFKWHDFKQKFEALHEFALGYHIGRQLQKYLCLSLQFIIEEMRFRKSKEMLIMEEGCFLLIVEIHLFT